MESNTKNKTDDENEIEIEMDELKDIKDIKLSVEFANILNALSSLKKNIVIIQNDIRNLEKNIKVKCNRLKNKKKTTEKQPSGFAKPMKISDDLCKFLNKDEGTELARTDVTRALIKYIEQNNLQDLSNKKLINPDTKLKYLLGLEDENQIITYFNIQKYMNRHFINTKSYKKLLNSE
jgi:chromatin remodeling complex protein RSC6